ncbi:diphthamide biosynthesis enzyme Dph2 [Methanococcoides sp. NM1]|uniref:diphthamide biosynthesis enzyme Dph2 n=1 Tax=Methanococcoides sp. NM1 TaxID=1201013 RepID=UPI001FCE57B4|nr:diphthamide biosynthesis enzyme Dph2 [Methanococcoides sp. NM1]
MSSSEPFDFRIEHIIDIIKDAQPAIIGLQFPEGFKRRAPAIASQISEATGVDILISANPCYGACDLDVAILDNVDILFHFGHAQLDDNSYSEKVIFIETRSDADVKEVVRKAVPEIRGKRVGVLTTVQHIQKLPEVCDILESEGKECLIGRGDSKIAYAGQVLGCNFSVADGLDCDEFLYIGSGEFHPLGVSLATGKRVLVADPFSNEVREVDPRRILKQRSAVIANSLDAETFGILVSTKPGQYRMALARQLKELAEKRGKTAYILTMDLITPDQMLQFKVDAFVSTACPRLAVDEVGRFSAPMLTPQEFEIVIGEREWEEITFDEIRGE